MPENIGIRRRYSVRKALSVHPTSVMDSFVRRFLTLFAILDETRRTQSSCRRVRTPATTS